jgi:D-xylose 1-dehydrogenase (NADP+, D-xylono-1,5-lactone-forming)
MRWGILSTANIGRKLIAGARDAGVELVAVGSRDEARGRAFADEFGIPRVHGSYEALLADDDVEAIYNPLPNSLHVPWSIRALEAGKHVLCEKPLTRDVGAVEQAFDAADRAGRVLMEAFMWRFHPQTARMLELVRSGTIGQLRHVNARFGFDLHPASGNVRWDEELEGGALMDVGCYCVSGMRLLAGEPLRVSAERVGHGVDGRVAAVLRFADDVTGTFDCGMDVHPRSGLEVVGDKGTLWIADPWHGQSPGIDVVGGERIEVERVNPYGRELLEVEAAVREGRAPALDRAESVGQARAIDALYRSAEEGHAITLTSG